MTPKESRYPLDWLRIAEKDRLRVDKLLQMQDAEAAGFYLQQAVEKILKAFLLSKGWRLERTHDLEALLAQATAFNSPMAQFAEICQTISGFYFFERYPFSATSTISEGDVSSALRAVSGLLEIIRNELTPKDLISR